MAKKSKAIEELAGSIKADGMTPVMENVEKDEAAVPDSTSGSQNLEQMLARLQSGYTPKTAEQLQQAASNRYQSVYDQKRLNARQAYENNDQALAQQLSGLQATYDKQRDASAENYRNASSQLDRQMQGRGMQRSSYGGATQANLMRKGAEAQQEINDAQAAAEKNIGEQRTLAAQQLERQLAEYNSSQTADELAYLEDLENREYERGMQNQAMQNELALAIHNAQFQQSQAAQDQRNWEANMAFQQQQANQSQQNFRANLDYQRQQAAQAQQNWVNEFNQNQQNWQTQFNYTQQQANQSQQNWAQQFAFEQQQAQQAQSNWQAEFDKRYGNKSSGSSSGSSRTNPTTPPTDNDPFGDLDEDKKKPIKSVGGSNPGRKNTYNQLM